MTNTRTRIAFKAEGLGIPDFGPVAGLALGDFLLGIDTGDDTFIYEYHGRATACFAIFQSDGPFKVKPIPPRLLFPENIRMRIDIHGSQALSGDRVIETKIYDPVTRSPGWADEKQVKMIGGIVAGMSLDGDFESIHPPSKRYWLDCELLKLPARNIQMRVGPIRIR